MGHGDNHWSRRQLLAHGAAAGGLALAGAPGALLAGPADPAGTATNLQGLAQALRGSLVTPADAAYDHARQVWNGMIDKRPLAIARCSGVADVMAVVRHAREHDLPVSVRGGGHNVAGKALKDGAITIDLGALGGVRVDPDARRARAGGGARWAAFDRESQAFDLTCTGGTVSSTGVGGLTLGGGLGWLMRKQGLSCDHLVSADVVTADGEFLTASATENADLFWALRGGGGNFGVVTSFEFALQPAEPVIGGFAIYSPSRLRDVLEFYREFTAAAPDSVTTMGGVLNGPPGTPVEGESVGWLGVCHSGPPAAGERALAPLRDFGEPVLGGFQPMPYLTLQTMFDGGSAAGGRNYWRSYFLTELPDGVIDTIVSYAEEGLQAEGTMVLMEHMGGAIREVGDHDTAFSNRGALHNVSVLGTWQDAADDEANVAWTREFGDAIKPWSTGAGYVNYMSGDESVERVRATYSANLERLVEVKRKYDPTNFFDANQNIAP